MLENAFGLCVAWQHVVSLAETRVRVNVRMRPGACLLYTLVTVHALSCTSTPHPLAVLWLKSRPRMDMVTTKGNKHCFVFVTFF